MATFAMIGVGLTAATPMAAAQQASEVEVERNNEIDQSIKQKQEACTNEAEVELSDDDYVDIVGDNEAEAEQFNFCDITQSQAASNEAAIVDESDNTVDLESILAEVGLSL